MAEAVITSFIDLRFRDLATTELKKVEQSMGRTGAAGRNAFVSIGREIRTNVRDLRNYLNVFGIFALANRFLVQPIEDWLAIAENTAKARKQLELYSILKIGGVSKDLVQTVETLERFGTLTAKEATELALFGDAAGATAHQVQNLGSMAQYLSESFGGDKLKAGEALIRAQTGDYEALAKALKFNVANAQELQKVMAGLYAQESAARLAKLEGAYKLGLSADTDEFRTPQRKAEERREQADAITYLRERVRLLREQAGGLTPTDPNQAARDKRDAEAMAAAKKAAQERAGAERDLAKEVREVALAEEQRIEALRKGFGSSRDQYDQAIKDAQDLATEQASVYAQTTKVVGVAQEMGAGFGTAFGTLVADAKTGKEAFKQFTKDMITQIIKLIVEFELLALARSLAGVGGSTLTATQQLQFSGGAEGGFIEANGGVIRGDMGRPRAFASGGVVHKPTMALFGEGANSEAFVPLPDGKHIPVILPHGGGGVTNNYYIDATDVDSFRAAMARNGDISAASAARAQQISPAYRKGMGTMGRLL